MARTPTSPPGTSPTAASGFTLLELLVVMLVMAVAVALLAPTLTGRTGLAQKREALTLASTLRDARIEASRSAGEVLVLFDMEDRKYQLTGQAPKPFPGGAEVTLTSAKQESEGTTQAIRFFPGGGSTGGSIELSFPGAAYRIDVDWLTGRVVIDDARG